MSEGAPDEPTARERELCVKVKASKRSNLVPGSKWNLVGIKWMKRWMNYVNFDGVRSPYTDHTHPGPMDNSPLLSEAGQLQRHMLEDLDYALVPNELYQAFEEEYGGGPSIVRNVVPCSGSRSIFMVDLYPMLYNIFVYDWAEFGTEQTTDATDGRSAGELPERPRVTVELSKYADFGDVKAAVWAALGIAGEPDRYNIWVRTPEYFSAYKTSAADATPAEEEESDGPRYLTRKVADQLPGSWVHLQEDIIYTHHYPNGVIDVMIELLEKEPPLEALPADRAEARLATEAWEDRVARKGLLSRWLCDLRVGDVVDGKDNTGKWFEAVIVPLPETAGEEPPVPGSVRLHFKCWSSKWDDTVSPQDIPSRVWPLYSKTPNWRSKLRAGQKLELLVSGPEEVPQWVVAVVSSVDHARCFVKVRYEYNSLQDFKTLSLQSEKLCFHPTHNMEQRAPAAVDATSSSTSYLTSYRSGSNSWMSSGRLHETGPLQAGGAPGVVGLRNLGNTCFMNSMLQCLSHAKPLTDVFLTDGYLKQINTTNVLGMGGKIANVYGRLLKDMWSQRYSVVNPYEFKDTIGQFQPQFAGYQQQDSQEFMLYLLDGLHEDMNRVQKKPFVEKIESRGRPDDLISREAWRRFLLRNDSELVDRVFGQLKSHVTCRNCGHQSVTFDEFNSLALPVPVKNTRRITVTLCPLPPGSVPIIVTVEVDLMARIKDLKDALVAAVGPEVLRAGSSARRCLKRGYDQADDSGDNGMDVDGLGGESYVLVGSGDGSPSSCSDDRAPDKSISKSASAMDIVLPPSPPDAASGDPLAALPVHLHVTSYSTYSKKVTCTLQDDSPVQDVMKQGSAQQLYVFQLENDASSREYHDYDTSSPGCNYNTHMSANERPAPTDKGFRYVDVAMMKRSSSSGNRGHTSYYSNYNYDSQYPSSIGPSVRLSYEIGVTRHKDLYAAVERLAIRLLPEGSPFEGFTRCGAAVVSRDSDDEQLPPPPFTVMYSNAYGTNVTDEFPYASEDTIDSILPRHQLVCLWSQDALAPVGSRNSPSPDSDGEDSAREARTVVESLFLRRRLLASGLSSPYVASADAIPGAPRAAADDPDGGGRRRVSINACLDKFIEREVMPDEETWYCPACKEHKSPIKKFDLWATPEILIVQLKRFQYIPGSYFIHREKISDLVEFPVEGLDLTRYVRGEQVGSPPPVYDLFAVSEHSGGLGGGHYTAVAKTPDTDEWVNYNDSHCSVATADDTVTPAAYILFYKRRGGHVKWAGIQPLPLGVLDEEKSS